MPAIVKKTVMASGGDYSSLAAWEAGEQRDLVALDQIAVAECHAFEDVQYRLDINGWTTSAVCFLRITAAPDARAGANFDGTRYVLRGRGSTCSVSYTVFDGIQIVIGYNAHNNVGIQIDKYAVEVTVRDCYIRCDGSYNTTYGNNQIGIHGGTDATGNRYFINTVVEVFSVAGYTGLKGIRTVKHGSGNSYVYNCTVYGCEEGVRDGYGDLVVINTVAQNCGVCFGGSFAPGSGFNASSDATAPGINTKPNTAVAFLNTAGRDFHLVESDTGARGAGTDLAADPRYAFSTDIDGQTRTAPWDIGADQHVTQTADGFDTPVVTSGPQGVQLSVSKLRDNTTGTVRVRVSDPNGKVADLGFVAAARSAVDGSIIRKGPFPPDRTPPAHGAHEKDLLLDATRDTEVTTVATLTDGTTFEAAAQALGPRLDSGSVVVRGENLTQEVRVSGLVFAGGTVEFDTEHNTATVRFPSGGGTGADATYLQLAGGTLTGKLAFVVGHAFALQLNNGSVLSASNAAGAEEGVFWPRWTDNNTYLNFGSGGNLFVRDNASNSKLTVHTGGISVWGQAVIGSREYTDLSVDRISDRLILTPPFHTGGPWIGKVIDVETRSQLRFQYGASGAFLQLASNGNLHLLANNAAQLSIQPGTDTDPLVDLQLPNARFMRWHENHGIYLDRGWFRFNDQRNSRFGLYWELGVFGAGYHIYPGGANSNDMMFRTGSVSGGIVGTVADETPRGYVHWTTGNEIGFLDHTRNWTLACSASWVRPLKPLYLGDMGQTGWGTMIAQGRVLSANNNIHLSPPDGTDVIIDTNYRQAGGAGGGVAGLRATGDIQARAFYLYSGERLATVIVRASTPTSSDAAPVGTLWCVV